MLRQSEGTIPSESRKNCIVSVDASRGTSCFGYAYRLFRREGGERDEVDREQHPQRDQDREAVLEHPDPDRPHRSSCSFFVRRSRRMKIADTTVRTRISVAYAAATFSSWFVFSHYASAASTVAVARDRDHRGEDLEREDDAKQQRHLDRRLEHRQRHGPERLPPTRSEHLRRLVELLGMPWSPATRMIMISAVERQISATTIVPIRTAWFEDRADMQDVRVADPQVLEDRVQVAAR